MRPRPRSLLPVPLLLVPLFPLALVFPLALAACGAGSGRASNRSAASSVTAAPTTSPPVSGTAPPSPVSTAAPAPPSPTTASAPRRPQVVADLLTKTSAAPAYSYQVRVPRLQGLADGAAQSRINQAVAAPANAAIADLVSSAAAAGSGPMPPVPGDASSGLQGDYEVTLLDDAAYSVLLRLSSYSAGAAHPSGSLASFTFDLRTGRQLNLADLFQPGAPYLQALADESRARLGAALGPDADQNLIREGTPPRDETFAAWNLLPHELRITFGEYSVAPYSAGAPTIAIPDASLAALVAPGGPLKGR